MMKQKIYDDDHNKDNGNENCTRYLAEIDNRLITVNDVTQENKSPS